MYLEGFQELLGSGASYLVCSIGLKSLNKFVQNVAPGSKMAPDGGTGLEV